MTTSYVHMGSPKCGSSSIRRWLTTYRDRFAEAGYSVPREYATVSHGWIFRDLDDQVVRPEGMAQALAQGYRARDPSWRDLQAAEARDIASSGCPNCVLSSEFFSVASDPARMLDGLPDGDVRPVMFVRDQVEAFDSSLYGLLKRPEVPYEEAVRIRLSWTFDFSAIDETWRDARLPVAVLPHEGNVVATLAAFVGLASPAIPLDVRVNRTLPAVVVAYLFRRKAAHLGDPRWPALCDVFEEGQSAFEDVPRGWCLDQDTRSDIAARHRQGNRRFLARHPELVAPFNRRGNWRDATPDTARVERLCDAIFRRAAHSVGLGGEDRR